MKKDFKIKWYQKINPLFWFGLWIKLSVAGIVYKTMKENIIQKKQK